jgi:acyl-CoA thioesterase
LLDEWVVLIDEFIQSFIFELHNFIKFGILKVTTMNSKALAYKIATQMIENDPFTKWLGIEIVSITEGSCDLKMKIRDEMLNGFEIAHGGITFSLADSAIAFASNSHGRKCVSLETSISHTKTCKSGNTIYAKAEEKSITNKIAIYNVTIRNQEKEIVALFKGTVYRTDDLF